VRVVDTDLATAAAGSLIWAGMEKKGIAPAVDYLDAEWSRDIMAVCEEHGVEPDYDDTFSLLVLFARDSNPLFADDMDAAYEWLLGAMKELRG
jgi:hypothetical protein